MRFGASLYEKISDRPIFRKDGKFSDEPMHSGINVKSGAQLVLLCGVKK